MSDLEHFIDLAARGSRSTSSSGEKRARRLADVSLENVPGLDARAREGLKEFIDIVAVAPNAARSVFEGET